MGREIRRVPKGWEHPKRADGRYQPMFDRTFVEVAREWLDEALAWDQGTHPDLQPGRHLQVSRARYPFYWQYHGPCPNEIYYRPEFTSPATSYQVYETVSEGTPISPVFETVKKLETWLCGQGMSREGARKFIGIGTVGGLVAIATRRAKARVKMIGDKVDGRRAQ